MCPIFTISYTRPFLLNLYYGIINEHNASDLSKLIILLPDQNSVLELKKIFRNKYKSACFLPKILALSDYRNIAKTFKLKLDYKSNEDRNLIVRGNLLNFISKLSYVELEDKIIIVQDLLKLFSELHQAGSDFNQLDLAFLGKSKDEQILYSILNDFKKLIIKKNLKPHEYILDFIKSDMLFQLSNYLKQNSDCNKKVILAGSSLSLFITENLASAIIDYKNSALYLIDYKNSGFDLDNNFIKDIKNLATELESKIPDLEITKKKTSCMIFESEYAEIEYINQQITNGTEGVIINGSNLRSNLTILNNPSSCNNEITLQKKIITSFFSINNKNLDIIRCELFKDEIFQDFFHQEELKHNFDIFAKNKQLHNFDPKQSFFQKFQILKNILKEYNIILNLTLESALENISTEVSNNKGLERLVEFGLLELYLADITAKNILPEFLYFSYEAKLTENKNIIIGGLNNKNWINQINYSYIKSDVLKQFGLRTERDFQILAIQDLLILLNSDNIKLTLTDDSHSDLLPILYFLEKLGQIEFKYIKPIIKQKKTYQPYAVMSRNNKVNKMSVSDFTLLLNNPYGVYVKRILRLINLQNIYKSSARRVYGVIIHRVIEDYTKNICNISLNSRVEYLQESFRKYIQRTKYKDLFLLLEDKVNNLFKWWVNEHDLITNKSNETKIESKYKALIHPQIMFSSIIDRLEIYDNNNFKLVDYKTSKLPTNSEIESGLYSQLILESLIYIKANNLSISNIIDPVLIQLAGDINFVQNRSLEIKNFANSLIDYEDDIIKLLDIFLDDGIKLYSFPHNSSLQKYSDYIHITRIGN